MALSKSTLQYIGYVKSLRRCYFPCLLQIPAADFRHSRGNNKKVECVFGSSDIPHLRNEPGKRDDSSCKQQLILLLTVQNV